jgi:hypothetical protein
MTDDTEKDKKPPKLTLVQKRAVDASARISLSPPEEIAYQHTVFCQTCLPYRDPGDEVREWRRQQGRVFLLVEAGQAYHPEVQDFVKVGLPFGPKARLILAHLNGEALRQDSPLVQVENTLTSFVRRIQDPLKGGRSPTGPEICKFKDQLVRISASTMRLAVDVDSRLLQVNSQIIGAFDLWAGKEEKQKVPWAGEIQLSHDYFTSLKKHAVPLDERALAALAHSAMGLDIYVWLAQRLHRIPANRPQFVSWAALQDQFGQGYSERRYFRRDFINTLRLVYGQYQSARFDIGAKGMTLFHSLPPVPPRGFVVKKPEAT